MNGWRRPVAGTSSGEVGDLAQYVPALGPGAIAIDLAAAFGIGRPVAESAAVVVRFATLGPDGPSGTLQEEAGVLPR